MDDDARVRGGDMDVGRRASYVWQNENGTHEYCCE